MSSFGDDGDSTLEYGKKGFAEFDTTEYKELFYSFLKNYCIEEVKEILYAEDAQANYSINVDFPELKNEDELGLADMLLAYPYDILPLFDESLAELQLKLLGEETKRDGIKGHVKDRSRVRIHNLPTSVLQLNETNLPRSCDVEKFMEVRGTVIRTGMAKTLEFEKTYTCTKCKNEVKCQVEPEQMDKFKKPGVCRYKKEGGEGLCLNKNFQEIEGSTDCRDYQEIKIQEQVHKLGMGSIPRSMVVILLDDLVDKCQAGDDITLSGIVLRRWRYFKEGVRPDLEVVLLANHLTVNNEKKFGVNMTDELKVEFENYWQEYADRPLEGIVHFLSE